MLPNWLLNENSCFKYTIFFTTGCRHTKVAPQHSPVRASRSPFFSFRTVRKQIYGVLVDLTGNNTSIKVSRLYSSTIMILFLPLIQFQSWEWHYNVCHVHCLVSPFSTFEILINWLPLPLNTCLFILQPHKPVQSQLLRVQSNVLSKYLSDDTDIQRQVLLSMLENVGY